MLAWFLSSGPLLPRRWQIVFRQKASRRKYDLLVHFPPRMKQSCQQGVDERKYFHKS